MANICPECGKENYTNAKFCKKCGAALQNTANNVNDNVEVKSSYNANNNNGEESNKNTLIICVTALICLIIIVGAFIFLNNDSNGTVDSETDVAVQEEDYGISFDEACSYFPDASSTVVGHVFDESDADGDGYLSDKEYKTFKDVKDFTKRWAVDITNDDAVNTPDLWNGDGSIRTRYCADHGRIAVADDDLCPYCEAKGYSDTRTRKDSTRYV